ncbi:hypothetical protein PVAND_012100 [Polypedilum vanderplanki]|uniref:Uncharacterized protein n=1 Tax=Polypedilum vanderplanki TaxID=319348 RepID=A0A9J6CLQ3_POLVA|nr:hypothetical protein PVAND_012100 [Polypedilum vanderplanki]
MKLSPKIKAIFAIFCIVLVALCVSFIFVYYRKPIEDIFEHFRYRRSNNVTADNSTQLISQMMEQKLNNSKTREKENVLATSLAKLLITSPEDIMKFITEENFGCKKINHAINTFRKNFYGDLRIDNTYIKLFRALDKFYNLICGENEIYRKIFSSFQDDIAKLNEEFAVCTGELDWYEKNSTIACDEGQKILNCYHEALIYDVGEKVAFYYDKVFKKIINSSLTHPCKFKQLKATFIDATVSASNNFFIINNYLIIFAVIIIIIS